MNHLHAGFILIWEYSSRQLSIIDLPRRVAVLQWGIHGMWYSIPLTVCLDGLLTSSIGSGKKNTIPSKGFASQVWSWPLLCATTCMTDEYLDILRSIVVYNLHELRVHGRYQCRIHAQVDAKIYFRILKLAVNMYLEWTSLKCPAYITPKYKPS